MHIIILTDINGCIGIGRYAGAYRIATELRNLGNDVEVIDYMMSFSNEELLRIIKSKKRKDTAWVGISSTFLFNRGFDPCVEKTEIKFENRKSSSIGMSEEEAQEFVNQIVNMGLKVFIGGAKIRYDLKNVKWIKGEGEYEFNKDFDFTTSTIDWQKKDHIMENEHLPIEISRGCIFKCKFCSFDLKGKKLWEFCKTPDVVEKEMIRNYDMFGVKNYMFCDDTYNDSMEKVIEFKKMYDGLPFDLGFSTYLRLDLLLSNEEQLPIIIDSGLKSVHFGIETLNHKTGKLIGKGMDPDKIKRGILDIRDKYPDLIMTISFIAGLPYETIESLNETMNWLNENNIDFYAFHVLELAMNSTFGKQREQFGYRMTEFGWENDYMDYRTALNFVKQSQKQDNSIGSFGATFSNRLSNLGYSFDEVKSLTLMNKDDIKERMDNIKNNYKNLVLNYI